MFDQVAQNSVKFGALRNAKLRIPAKRKYEIVVIHSNHAEHVAIPERNVYLGDDPHPLRLHTFGYPKLGSEKFKDMIAKSEDQVTFYRRANAIRKGAENLPVMWYVDRGLCKLGGEVLHPASEHAYDMEISTIPIIGAWRTEIHCVPVKGRVRSRGTI
jgi:hypothetical protein